MNQNAGCEKRRLLLKALGGAAGFAGIGTSFAAEPPPETRRVRIAHITGGSCWAPQYVAADLLRDEIAASRRPVIVTHTRVDADAVGSAVAMAALCRALGVEPAATRAGDPPTSRRS